MLRYTKILCLQGVLVLGAVFLFASFSQASEGHHSHHHNKTVSPFDKVNSDKPLHCLLNAHLHKTKEACPHNSNHSNKGKSTELRVDCGSNPVNSEGISFGSDFPQYTQSDEFNHHLVIQAVPPLVEGDISIFYHSIERPPQLS